MTRQKWMWVLVTLFAVVLFACGEPQQEQPAEENESSVGLLATDPSQFAVTLWKKDVSWYETWELLPGTKAKQLSNGNPHGMYGSVYGNTLAIAAARGNVERMPEGSIIVRENYNKEEEILRITTMRKTNGSWFWTVYDADGTVELAGNLDACVSCHSDAERDMLFFWGNEQLQIE